MSVISIRGIAASLLALLLLTLPQAGRDTGRAASRSDAPFTYTAQHDAMVLRPQPSAVVSEKRQRLFTWWGCCPSFTRGGSSGQRIGGTNAEIEQPCSQALAARGPRARSAGHLIARSHP
jgi:hypothetical protein